MLVEVLVEVELGVVGTGATYGADVEVDVVTGFDWWE